MLSIMPEEAKRGGAALVGRSILDCHNEHSCDMIRKVADWFAADKTHNRVHTYYSEKRNKDVYMIALRDDAGEPIGYYEKHEYRTRDDSPLYDVDVVKNPQYFSTNIVKLSPNNCILFYGVI